MAPNIAITTEPVDAPVRPESSIATPRSGSGMASSGNRRRGSRAFGSIARSGAGAASDSGFGFTVWCSDVCRQGRAVALGETRGCGALPAFLAVSEAWMEQGLGLAMGNCRLNASVVISRFDGGAGDVGAHLGDGTGRCGRS